MYSRTLTKKLLLAILIMLSIATFPVNNWAAGLNPTQYVLKGVPAPFSGFVVEQDRLQMCVTAVQDANYYRDLAALQEKFYEQKMADNAKIADLTLQLKTNEDKAVEDGLKKELKSKTVWYKQYWFTVPATALVIVLSQGLLVP